ncbi:hypothetical protein AVEN_271239-1 [Araneus ventricosus]|uniref:Integrase zinc-binding domain-containing protein n=1 Tax=Araneus ventricosus TaxID=182803 RepID=A0A4Y2G1K9_ARAVE|nr:hypothetical protein AVEN_271239-1 [Araneus ventricosus]
MTNSSPRVHRPVYHRSSIYIWLRQFGGRYIFRDRSNFGSGSIDFDEMTVAQDSDVELRSLLESGSGLELKQLNLPSSQRLLYCDISTGKVRPYVPETFRRKVFEMLHGLSHPGVKATTNLIKQRFVWKSVNKDVQELCVNSASHAKNLKSIGTLNRH